MGCGSSKPKAATPAAPAVSPEGDFKVELAKTENLQTVGLTIVAGKEPVGILVQAVKEEGLVPTYNKSKEGTPDVQVQEGDVIVAVNGLFGDFELMKKELAAATLALAIKRPGVPAPATEVAAAAAPEAAATDAAASAEAAPAEATVTEPAAEPAADAPAETENVAAAPAREAANTTESPAADVQPPPTEEAPKQSDLLGGADTIPVTEAEQEVVVEEKTTLCC
eukprot:TRINITY_DN10979_c0_g1_i1.p1 TRINITY_DN10979_c0_g1~~TRINITY_DN10979_c0_g1_i1.p1  ORF type:complete len:224 (+),score=87.84 TRINITY_DN10979_c0_g1_i1:87-758(+)